MGLLDWLSPKPQIDPVLRARIERAVDLAEPRLRQEGDYAYRLLPAVRRALEYCSAIAERVPGPVEISRSAFALDPLVHALFGAADDIEAMLAKSECVRTQMLDMTVATGRCCGLLGMRHREKSGFGVALEGDIVRADVPQRTLYFTDHTLAEPSPDPAAARLRLRDSLFEGLARSFASHVAEARAEHAGLHQEEIYARACLNQDRERYARRLEQLREQLRASDDALATHRLLQTFCDVLAAPESHLRLDPVTLNVDRNGIIVGPGGAVGSDTLQFAELTTRDQRRWVVFLAIFDREEIQRALDRLESARRFIII